jgi:hypothetical protein
MKEKDELKKLVLKMNDKQLAWFIDQMQHVLFEEACEPAL